MCPTFALCPLRSGGLTLEEATSADSPSKQYKLAQETERTAPNFQRQRLSYDKLCKLNVNDFVSKMFSQPLEWDVNGRQHIDVYRAKWQRDKA